MTFEFTNNTGHRIIIIGETYRAYEQDDGSVVLNDEKQGYTFRPTESYMDFRTRFNLDD